MLLNVLSAACMAGMFLYMVCCAKMEETRKLLWLPAATCAMELMTMGVLSITGFPLLTALLIVLRVALVGCCVVVMRRDAALVRAQQRRRARLKRELHAALHPLHEIPTSHCPVAATARIA